MPAILLLTGASGAGKTTLLRAVAGFGPVATVECDEAWASLDPAVQADAAAAQDALLDYGIRRAEEMAGMAVAVLTAQIRPHRAAALLERRGVKRFQIVVVECEQQEREARLRGERAQPELATPRMECWAAYLRGQADALGLVCLDTSTGAPVDAVEHLRRLVGELA